MSNMAIRVENLSKKYKIGVARQRHDTLRDAITAAFTSVFRSNGHGRADSSHPSDSIWALKEVSFEVKHGEVVGFIGRNGAGKSTLLKILSRITEPTSGRVEIYGRVGSLLEVGTGFHPELTGRENIYLNGAILGMKKWEIDKKFDEIVAFSEVEKFIDTPVKRYSSGMHVRLAFAVAAHLEPEILIVDEVLAVGDTAFQKKCLGKMGDVAKEGRTVLFVSHNMGAVASLCGRGVLLCEGRVLVSGDATSVITVYLQGNEDVPQTHSLIDHPNRDRGLRQLLTRFFLETNSGIAYYGRPLSFKIGYNFTEPIAVPQFCVSFHNINGIKVFTVISDYQRNTIPGSLQGEGEIICRIHSLPLLPGSYTVSLRLWQPGQKLDDIENVARFKVEWLEREIGQFNWDDAMGVVYVEADWSPGTDQKEISG
jgi:lipopolysaccharide transport system ATP-binding protein